MFSVRRQCASCWSRLMVKDVGHCGRGEMLNFLPCLRHGPRLGGVSGGPRTPGGASHVTEGLVLAKLVHEATLTRFPTLGKESTRVEDCIFFTGVAFVLPLILKLFQSRLGLCLRVHFLCRTRSPALEPETAPAHGVSFPEIPGTCPDQGHSLISATSHVASSREVQSDVNEPSN